MRFVTSCLMLAISSLALSGCVEDWDIDGPRAQPGGVGILSDGTLSEGPGTVSSVSKLPAGNINGPIQPFGSRGQVSAYEFGTGYKVGSGDKLVIRVAGEADLTGEFPVDASGAISLPYVQSVTVAGMTTPQIENMIAQKLKSGYIRNPQVSVQAVSLRPFFIMGEVGTAGSFPYQAGLNVQQAVAIAAGFGPRAEKSMVMLTRRDARGTFSKLVPLVTQVYPGDIIYVRERWF